MLEWFNENEMRAYPIVEDGSRQAKEGTVLPNAIIADLSVTVDADKADQVFINSIGITPSLASIGIATASEGLLVTTIANPEPHVPYRLEPLLPGVSGFVVFGHEIKTIGNVTFTFDSVGETKLEGKAVRPFETPPVRSLGKAWVDDAAALGDGPGIGVVPRSGSTPLYGVVNIAVTGDLYLRSDGNTIFIGLKEGVRPLYVGPCDRIIDYITCGKPPLRMINGVGPDGNGIITIEVQ